jgi:hypothetical protein
MKHAEHEQQVLLIEWFRAQYPLLRGCLWAIPNGGVRNIGTAIKLKREGVIAGVSDLFLMVAKGGHHGLFIEMKSKAGKPQQNQLEFIKLAQLMGYAAVVCFGFSEAKDQVKNYLAS